MFSHDGIQCTTNECAIIFNILWISDWQMNVWYMIIFVNTCIFFFHSKWQRVRNFFVSTFQPETTWFSCDIVLIEVTCDFSWLLYQLQRIRYNLNPNKSTGFKFNIHDNYTENNLYSYKQNQDCELVLYMHFVLIWYSYVTSVVLWPWLIVIIMYQVPIWGQLNVFYVVVSKTCIKYI